MEGENNHEVKAVILLQTGQVYMHRLLNKEKTLFTSGTLKIAKLENNKQGTVYFININSFYYGIHQNAFFIKMLYADTVSYIFPHFDHGLSAISLLASDNSITSIDDILFHSSKLFTNLSLVQVPQIKNAIQTHYPQINDQIYCPDKIKQIISTSGKVFNTAFTAFGGLLKTGVEKVGNFINNKVDQSQPTQIKPETKQRWQKLKQGTNNFFKVSGEYANKIMTPIFTKTKQYTEQIGHKIDSSSNQTIKYAKQLAQVSGKAIGQAFDGIVKGSTEVTKQIGQQSKKLITKKFGEDVVDTIVGKKQEQKMEKFHEQQMHEPRQNENKLQESSTNLLKENISQDNLYPKIQK